jgi:hypothetical protein
VIANKEKQNIQLEAILIRYIQRRGEAMEERVAGSPRPACLAMVSLGWRLGAGGMPAQWLLPAGWDGVTASEDGSRRRSLPAIQQYYESNSTKPKKCLPYLVVSAGRDSF